MYNFKQTFVVRNPNSKQSATLGHRSNSDWDLHKQEKQQQELSSVQLVPLMDRIGDLGGRRSSSSEPEERLRGLETRLKVAEKSNKALLDEVVRLQTELKSVSRRGEDALREERKARQFLENSLKSSNDLVNQLAQRIRTQEEKLQEERGILDNLANHTRSVEQEVSSKKEAQQSRIAALERDLENMTRAKSQLERVSFKLVDEMRGLKARLEEAGSVKDKSQRLEAAQEKLDRAGDVYQQSQQLRGQLETALEQLRSLVADLRSRLKQESTERQQLEQKLSSRLSELHRSIGEQARRRETSARHIDAQQRERERLVESDWLQLQAKIQEAVEQLNQRILEKEVKLREDAAKNQAESERMLLREQESRITQEREARHQQEERWDQLRRAQDEQLEQLRRAQRKELAASAELLNNVSQSLQQLEQRLHDDVRGVSVQVQEEVASRKSQDVEFSTKLHSVEEKVAASAAAFKQEVADLEAKLRSLPKHAGQPQDQGNIEELLEEYRKDTSKKIGSIEEQVSEFRQQLERLDAKIDAKTVTSSDQQLRELAEKLESLHSWRVTAAAQIADISKKQTDTSAMAQTNEQKIRITHNQLEERLGGEVYGRVQDIDSLREELQAIKDLIPSNTATAAAAADDGALRKDLDECQTLVRKLAEAVQTVKTVLGMKIQAEQKLRLQEMQSVQETVQEQKARLDAVQAKVNAAGGSDDQAAGDGAAAPAGGAAAGGAGKKKGKKPPA